MSGGGSASYRTALVMPPGRKCDNNTKCSLIFLKQKYGICDAYKNIKKYPMVILVVDVLHTSLVVSLSIVCSSKLDIR